MSLSKTIIYGTAQAVADELTQKPTLEEIDVYGYTPLIQTAIVNDPKKCQLLIDEDADVNFTDLTGRSALHWATDNNNLDIAKQLLAKKADPNVYTSAGQPALAMPFLRHHTQMKELLYQAGADLEFARDFINAKTLGHRFDLQGRVDIVSPDNTFIEVEFEGFYSEFTLSLALQSLLDFQTNFSAKHLREHFHRIGTIAKLLRNAVELIKYQQYLVDIVNHNDRINALLDHSPLLLPIVYDGHAISLVKLRNYLIRCDRGTFGQANGTVIIYRIDMPDKFNKHFMKNLLYKRQSHQFIDNDLAKLIGLKPIDYLELPVQLSGNCAWANIEAVIPAILYLNLLEETQARTQSAIYECKKAAISVLHQWELWDQQRALHFCIDSFDRANPARKASKAAILMAILFQQQLYRHPQWLSFCERIAHIITLPEYDYILHCYLNVFGRDKVKQPMQPLLSFLDDLGIVFSP